MEINVVDKDYSFDFTDCPDEKSFFLNVFELSLDIVKDAYKESDKVSVSIKEKIDELLRYSRREKLLRVNGDIVLIRKEYLEILFQNMQTYLMVILKDDKHLKASLKEQYTFLEIFLKNFLQACLSSYNET